jgi:hypothetical protein
MILLEMVLVCPCEFVKSLSGVPRLPRYESIRKCSQIFVFEKKFLAWKAPGSLDSLVVDTSRSHDSLVVKTVLSVAMASR